MRQLALLILVFISFSSLAENFPGFNPSGQCDSLTLSFFKKRIAQVKAKPPYANGIIKSVGTGFLINGGVVSLREVLSHQRYSKGYPDFKIETSEFTVPVTFAENLTREFSMFYLEVEAPELKYPNVTLPVENEEVVILGFRKGQNTLWKSKGRVTKVVMGRMKIQAEGGSELYGSAVYNCFGHLVGMVYEGEFLGHNNFPVKVEAYTFESLRRVWPFVKRPEVSGGYVLN